MDQMELPDTQAFTRPERPTPRTLYGRKYNSYSRFHNEAPRNGNQMWAHKRKNTNESGLTCCGSRGAAKIALIICLILIVLAIVLLVLIEHDVINLRKEKIKNNGSNFRAAAYIYANNLSETISSTTTPISTSTSTSTTSTATTSSTTSTSTSSTSTTTTSTSTTTTTTTTQIEYDGTNCPEGRFGYDCSQSISTVREEYLSIPANNEVLFLGPKASDTHFCYWIFQTQKNTVFASNGNSWTTCSSATEGAILGHIDTFEDWVSLKETMNGLRSSSNNQWPLTCKECWIGARRLQNQWKWVNSTLVSDGVDLEEKWSNISEYFVERDVQDRGLILLRDPGAGYNWVNVNPEKNKLQYGFADCWDNCYHVHCSLCQTPC